MNPIARLALFAAALLTSGAVQANCKPLLAAAEKMARQPRFAVYDVDKPEQPLPAEPDAVIIGKIGYVRDGDTWERVELGEFGDFIGQRMERLRREIAAGEVRCTAAGTGTFRGAPISKIRYEGIAGGSRELRSGIVWIETRSGLPVYEGTSDEGLFVVYGDAVKEPLVRK